MSDVHCIGIGWNNCLQVRNFVARRQWKEVYIIIYLITLLFLFSIPNQCIIYRPSFLIKLGIKPRITCNRQIYQNYEQSRQKLGRLKKIFNNQSFQKNSFLILKNDFESTNFAIFELRSLFIILVGLTMTWFSEDFFISNICRRGLMPNLIKKSVTVSIWHFFSPAHNSRVFLIMLQVNLEEMAVGLQARRNVWKFEGPDGGWVVMQGFFKEKILLLF